MIFLNYIQSIHLTHWFYHSKIINLKGVDDPKNTFADAAAPDTYLLQAWPQGAESRTFATNVLKKIKGVVNEERRATPDMVKKVMF